jgi:hypothetical protein
MVQSLAVASTMHGAGKPGLELTWIIDIHEENGAGGGQERAVKSSSWYQAFPPTGVMHRQIFFGVRTRKQEVTNADLCAASGLPLPAVLLPSVRTPTSVDKVDGVGDELTSFSTVEENGEDELQIPFYAVARGWSSSAAARRLCTQRPLRIPLSLTLFGSEGAAEAETCKAAKPVDIKQR